MNGAESLVRTLLACGIETCFANPGTSEMHFVAALDKIEGIRCILGMAETVVTGCADGYARMAGKPAATLLHCGPGLANGLANMHNARRAHSPMVNIVGDHATFHRPFDAPLTADTEGLARAVSHWVRTSSSSATVGADGAAAAQAARTAPGRIATLILPADVSWNEGGAVAQPLPFSAYGKVAPESVRAIAQALQTGEPAVLILSGRALSEAGLTAANRIAHACGATLRASNPVARMARGRGRPPVNRVPYVVDGAVRMLAGTKHLILVGAKPPTAFFAYPGKPSLTAPPDAAVYVLAEPHQDEVDALEQLADALGAPRTAPILEDEAEPQPGRGKFTPEAFAGTLAAYLPGNCIVVEDAV
ncbi:MAG: acetolactate synthase large subunit, partial [Deltaproteobacteria bacterium]|nr:acetolactate synthase large subunit [Deltaproteobacteria bacterium]